MTLMAGPIDTRVNPTKVNELAQSKPMRLVRAKPDRDACRRAIPARGRRVYPGFVQLAAFMSMNIDRHLQGASRALPAPGQRRDREGEGHQGLLRRVFRRARPCRGVLSGDRAAGVPGARARARRAHMARQARSSRARSAAPCCSRSRASATTSARSARRWPRTTCARVCAPISSATTCRLGVGHYGVFSGRRWETQVYPLVKNVILASD